VKKALLIGVIVSVLALGGIGAAFATGMSFPANVGALSTGAVGIPQVNVDGVTWWVNNLYPDAYVDTVTISFDRDLAANTEYGVTVVGTGDSVLANIWARSSAAVLKENRVAIPFCQNTATVTILGGAIALPGIKVADVYGIRVIVSEETYPE
jgi:predicted outer membrane repeat protein